MRDNGGQNRQSDRIRCSWINIWRKPPLDQHLFRVSRGIAMNRSRCVLSGELLCVGPYLMVRWFLRFLTVYKIWTQSTFGFQAPVTSIMRGPQELENKSAWFSRFGSKTQRASACVGTTVGAGAALGTPVGNLQRRFLPYLFGSSILLMRLLHPGSPSSLILLSSVSGGQIFSLVPSRFEASCWPIVQQDPLKIRNLW